MPKMVELGSRRYGLWHWVYTIAPDWGSHEFIKFHGFSPLPWLNPQFGYSWFFVAERCWLAPSGKQPGRFQTPWPTEVFLDHAKGFGMQRVFIVCVCVCVLWKSLEKMVITHGMTWMTWMYRDVLIITNMILRCLIQWICFFLPFLKLGNRIAGVMGRYGSVSKLITSKWFHTESSRNIWFGGASFWTYPFQVWHEFVSKYVPKSSCLIMIDHHFPHETCHLEAPPF